MRRFMTKRRQALQANPIVRQLVAKGSVVLTPVPETHTQLSESALRATEW